MSKKTVQPEEGLKRRIRVQFDITYGGDSGKVMDDEQITVPDMHLTVQQLLENHTRQSDGTIGIQQPLYLETEIPTITDITDVEAFKSSLERRLEDVNAWIAKEKEEKEKALEEEQENNLRYKEQIEESAKKIKEGKQTRIPDAE